MYSYTYDPATGGLLLNFSPTNFSREPRPVYAPELELLGFDKYWTYDRQSEAPYMWAEANQYFYRGLLVAKLKGGNAFTAPEIIIPEDESGQPVMPEPPGKVLRPVDIPAMVAANREVLDVIEQVTVKRIVATYTKYKKRVDCFHVAFSGGKDSCVLLDLVKKALPKGSFVVIFGDTGMEFPDTYEVVRRTQAQCQEENIAFYIAKSHLDPQESWNLFGPPSRVLRWCCSVHKSAPQTLKLRGITEKSNFTGLDFVGIRSQESVQRSNYTFENYGKKQKGQYSYNAILDWTSAEIWLYMYKYNIYINNTYKKGNARAGCLFCPMSGGISDFFRRSSYQQEIDVFIHIIQSTYSANSKEKKESYVINGGWNARKNGRELLKNDFLCTESSKEGNLIISVIKPKSEWKEWIKTIGYIYEYGNIYYIQYENDNIQFTVNDTEKGYIVQIKETILKKYPEFSKLFRQVFRKSAYCTGCRVCETNCRNGFISFSDGKVKIKNCVQCHECHAIDGGCLLFHSLRHPQGGGKSMKSLNSFADHAPKIEWLHSFFELKESFFTEHNLGPMMFDMFRRFLKDASLNEKNHFTRFAELVSQIGWDTDTSQGLILINLSCENPQIQWYINNFEINKMYSRKAVEDMLTSVEVKPKDAKSIFKAYKRISLTPLGTVLHFGYVTDKDELVRTKCSITDPRVFLYGLFKFAEKCNNYKEFTLATLMNDSIERDGITPTRIFGLSREDVIPMLLGLSARYSDFIIASFTHDLEKITLAEDKNSQDVLALFQETAHV